MKNYADDLQYKTVKKMYFILIFLSETNLSLNANEFCFRMDRILDENRELPNDFLTELYKWALECKFFYRRDC